MAGGSYGNPYMGQNLSAQSAGAFTGALGGAGQAVNQGQTALGLGSMFGQQAGEGYGTLGATAPNVTSGQLSTTDLAPYMNPFTRDVTDTTMAELNRQEALQAKGLAGQAQDQGAFGGDRFAIQQAENNRNFDQTRANALAGLNQANFSQAQRGATGDIANRFAADQYNTTQRAENLRTGAVGQEGLASIFGQAGINLGAQGNRDLGNLSQQGFDYGQTMNRNQMQTGAAMQDQIQKLIDAANAQFGGATGQPQTGLDTILGSLQGTYNPTTTNQTTDNGLGGILGAAGSFVPAK